MIIHFLSLWPSSLEIEFDIPIPADVSNKLGWNALPGSSVATTTNEFADEENSKQSELVEENSVNKSRRTSSRDTGRSKVVEKSCLSPEMKRRLMRNYNQLMIHSID